MKKQTKTSLLTLGALGVVFGDIGTSPLYALPAIFGLKRHANPFSEASVLGILSLIIWSVTLVVAVKYIMLLMRADNRGEGGIIALIGLIKEKAHGTKIVSLSVLLGLVGVALFYGDSLITPAISLLSASEGIKVAAPNLEHFILPFALLLICILFFVQKYGTGSIAKFFGPIMLLWFASMTAAGAWQIAQEPAVIAALSPLHALQFVQASPMTAFIAMGAVLLTITGAEALYADMGHFGRRPIMFAWFIVVFPALIVCYLGQGALLLRDPAAIVNPFITMFPSAMYVPMVALSAIATLIASQAVISGAFSLTRSAVHLNFLPKLRIYHTSAREQGQVYLPFINILLFIGVIALVLVFKSSAQLASAYGLAVSITLLIDSILFLVVMRAVWRTSVIWVGLMGLVFIVLDSIFVASAMTKVVTGGWVTLLIALTIFFVITTWIKGRRLIAHERELREGKLMDYIDKVRAMSPPITRVPGQGVYIGHHKQLAPLALHASVENLHELHEKVVIVSVNVSNVAHIPSTERARFDPLSNDVDGISFVELTYGYFDHINIPKTLESLRGLSIELDFSSEQTSYFISLARIVPTKSHTMARWRKSLFCFMANNSSNADNYYKLPIDSTIEIRSMLKI